MNFKNYYMNKLNNKSKRIQTKEVNKLALDYFINLKNEVPIDEIEYFDYIIEILKAIDKKL